MRSAGVVGVALGDFDIALQEPAESQLLAKALHQHHSAKMGQLRLGERKIECSQAFWHRTKVVLALFLSVAQSSLKVKFVQQTEKALPNLFLRVFSSILCAIHAFLRFK